MRERDAEFRGKPLEEIYADPIKFRCLIHNHMVKMLVDHAGRDDRRRSSRCSTSTPTHLERAKRNLVERIDVWGVQEHFEEFCDELTRRFGWDLGPPAVRQPHQAVPESPRSSAPASPRTTRSTSSSTATPCGCASEDRRSDRRNPSVHGLTEAAGTYGSRRDASGG